MSDDRDDVDQWGGEPAASSTPGDVAVHDDAGETRTADGGLDSTVAPWETGHGNGGVLRALGESVGTVVLGLVVAFALALGGGIAMIVAGFDPTSVPVLIVSLLGSQAGFAGAALLYLRWRDEPLANVGIAVPGLKSVAIVVGGVLALLMLVLVAGIVVQTLGLESAENSTTSTASEVPSSLLLLIPLMLLVVGPCEELLFRGTVQRRLREVASAPIAIGITSVLFASVHFVALIGDLSAIATSISILLLPAVVLGVLYEYTKNLVVVALVHGLYNSTLLLLFYVSLQFGQDSAGGASAVVVDALSVLL